VAPEDYRCPNCCHKVRLWPFGLAAMRDFPLQEHFFTTSHHLPCLFPNDNVSFTLLVTRSRSTSGHGPRMPGGGGKGRGQPPVPYPVLDDGFGVQVSPQLWFTSVEALLELRPCVVYRRESGTPTSTTCQSGPWRSWGWPRGTPNPWRPSPTAWPR